MKPQWLPSTFFIFFIHHYLNIRYFMPLGLDTDSAVTTLNAELNPICYLLALLGDHHFLHVSRIRVKSLILRLLSYTGCPRRKGQNFGRVFLMLKYTDITQNTYIQS